MPPERHIWGSIIFSLQFSSFKQANRKEPVGHSSPAALRPDPRGGHRAPLRLLRVSQRPTAAHLCVNSSFCGGDRIPGELFKILKDDAVKMLHSIHRQIWKPQCWHEDWKRSVFIPTPKKGNAKECSNYCILVLISHASKVMLKILKLGFSGMWTKNFQMYKVDSEKAGEPELKLPTYTGS